MERSYQDIVMITHIKKYCKGKPNEVVLYSNETEITTLARIPEETPSPQKTTSPPVDIEEIIPYIPTI